MAEYIERDAAHRAMVGLTRYSWTSPISIEHHVTVDVDDVNFGLDKIPAADVAPVMHGRWIENGLGYTCSVCNKLHITGTSMKTLKFKFCPYCGKKMDKEDK